MQKKASTKGGSKKGKGRRKLTDLAPKKVKGGEAVSVKGGTIDWGDGSARRPKLG